MKIRRAAHGDLDWIVKQMREFSSSYETKYRLFGHEEFVRAGVVRMLTEHVIFVAETDHGQPAGFIVGISLPHLFNPEIWTLTELFWWIDKKHRGSRAAFALLQAFIDHGKKCANWVVLTMTSYSRLNEKTILKRGFRLQEKSFLLEV